MVARWVDWATRSSSQWPDDVRHASLDPAAAEEGVRLAASVTTLLASNTSRLR